MLGPRLGAEWEGTLLPGSARGFEPADAGRRSEPGNCPPEDPPTTHVNVVLNWFEELKRLVPPE
jgi:hypothetical protein